jgi:hypothetical protein
MSRHVFLMTEQMPRIIDMTPDGDFVSPRPERRPAGSFAVALGLSAAIVATIAVAVAVAALVLWVASIMIPVALVAGVVAYAAFRFQMWRTRRR